MSDIDIFTDENLWIPVGLGITAILCPPTVAGWTRRKVNVA